MKKVNNNFYIKTYKLLLFPVILIFIFVLCLLLPSQQDSLFGIDLSKWNGEIHTIPQDVKFVIIRCGYTSSDSNTLNEDPLFKDYLDLCNEQNIPVGVYYYTMATTIQDATNEAQFVLDLIADYDIPLGVFFDIEDSTLLDYDDQLLNDICNAFCQEIEYNHYNAGIYASYYWWNHILDKEQLPYLKWIALYDDSSYILEDDYLIYQYTNTGTLEGYSCYFDFNTIKYKYW